MLAAIWNLDGRPLGRSVIDRVLAPLSPAGEVRPSRALWREGSVALAIVPPSHAAMGDPPTPGPSGIALAFDGRLGDRHGLVGELGDLPEADELMTDADLVLAAYARWGEDFVEHLVGDFALVLFDPRRQWFLLARDPSGSRPLHYLRFPDTMLVASRMDALLSHPSARRGPNEAQLARMVLGGAPQRDSLSSTPFDAVHSVPPGHVAILTRGRFVTRRYPDPDLQPPVEVITHGTKDAFSDVLVQAIARQAAGRPVVIDLGGWGGASILGAALRAEGLPVVALVPPGRSVPAAAQAVVRIEPPPPGSLVDAAEERIAIAEDFRIDPWWKPRWTAMREAAAAGGVIWLSARGARHLLADESYLADLVRRGSVREAFQEVPGPLPSRARSVGRSAARGLVPEGLQRPARAVSAYVRGPLRDADWYTGSFRNWALKPSAGDTEADGVASQGARGLYRTARSLEMILGVERDAKTGAAAGLEVAFPFLAGDVLRTLMAIPGQERLRGSDPAWLLPVPPGASLPDPSGPMVLEVWEECRRRLMRVAAATGAGYVDGALLGSELEYLRDDIADGQATALHRVLDLLGLELWMERLPEPG